MKALTSRHGERGDQVNCCRSPPGLMYRCLSRRRGALQVLPAVRQLLLLRRDGDGLLLHAGAEGGATAHPQQIPPLHLLRPLPHRYAHHRPALGPFVMSQMESVSSAPAWFLFQVGESSTTFFLKRYRPKESSVRSDLPPKVTKEIEIEPTANQNSD